MLFFLFVMMVVIVLAIAAVVLAQRDGWKSGCHSAIISGMDISKAGNKQCRVVIRLLLLGWHYNNSCYLMV